MTNKVNTVGCLSASTSAFIIGLFITITICKKKSTALYFMIVNQSMGAFRQCGAFAVVERVGLLDPSADQTPISQIQPSYHGETTRTHLVASRVANKQK